jgi:glutathione S-transferase
VPALGLDDGETLTENIAILGYIASMSGKLIPQSGLPHWRVIETTAFISTELHKNFKPFFTPAATDAEKAAAADILTKRFALMEERLGDRAFIVGEEMSIADCYLFVMLFWAATKISLELPRHLSGYYDRLKDQPSIKRAMADEDL